MNILTFFTKNLNPILGLTPTIRIRDILDNSLVITDDLMIEVGDGWYKYDFSGYNENLLYAIRCDGGSTLTGSERYTYAGNDVGAFGNIIKRILGLSQENYRIFNPTYVTKNRQSCMTAGTIKTYPTANDCENDTNALATYEVTATFNKQAEMTSYKVKRTT